MYLLNVCLCSQDVLRHGLLEVLGKEENQSLKASICNIVGEFAGIVLEPAEWPEILSFAYGCIQVESPYDSYSISFLLVYCIFNDLKNYSQATHKTERQA